MKDSATLGEFEKKHCFLIKKNQKKQTKFHKSQIKIIEIINEGNMLTKNISDYMRIYIRVVRGEEIMTNVLILVQQKTSSRHSSRKNKLPDKLWFYFP